MLLHAYYYASCRLPLDSYKLLRSEDIYTLSIMSLGASLRRTHALCKTGRNDGFGFSTLHAASAKLIKGLRYAKKEQRARIDKDGRNAMTFGLLQALRRASAWLLTLDRAVLEDKAVTCVKSPGL